MFLQVCVCPRGGEGVCLSACWDAMPPRDQADPPWVENLENPPRWRNPPGMETPPGWRTPPGKQTPAYGLRAAGTHPSGMHSCNIVSLSIQRRCVTFCAMKISDVDTEANVTCKRTINSTHDHSGK